MTNVVKKIEAPAARKLILVLDVENAPKASKEALMTHLSSKDCAHIIMAYAKTNLNFNIDEVSLIAKALQSGRVIFYKMKSCGKNAADFGLTFFAGQLSGKYKPHEVQFRVLSNDHDLDYMVQILSSSGYKVERINTQRPTQPAPQKPKPVLVSAVVQRKSCVAV